MENTCCDIFHEIIVYIFLLFQKSRQVGKTVVINYSHRILYLILSRYAVQKKQIIYDGCNKCKTM